ncbi:DUF4386 domain-containing protein [Streptomyces cyanogenus]|uniref:DUF4386 domain-containing protein n=1 Tax=Streptomyces cyanogenus TaxID=80860 RepID=A0ABX7U274_STRCY|nr:DUF4386 domain-containing protein [Streptomyces cyanogenus]QTE03150.1 hypothetical protein S1361_37790 [Streptomyces cyanogenus]
MTSDRRAAMVGGLLYLVTHVTSVAALVLYEPVLKHTDYVVGPGSDTGVLVGVLLEVILALAVVGTAVALFPVVKRHNEGAALGYVGLRTLEAGVIAVGVVPLLALVTLRHDLAGTADSDATTLASALVAFHNWTFLVGPSFVCGTNTVLIAYPLYHSGLVPRFIPVLGLAGGPLVFASGAAQMFGVYEQFSVWAALAAIPVFAWEICLALYLILKGFRPSVAAGPAAVPSGASAYPAAV